MTWVMPFPESSITSEFGTLSTYRRVRGYQPHSGTDWAPRGSRTGKTLIPSIADGAVGLVQFSKILGWVVVQTAMGQDKTIWYLGYCHLKCNTHGINCKGGHASSLAVNVEVGDKLVAGDTSHGLTMGNSGTASSGVHLHVTAGKALKSVFGVTAQKSDIKKIILRELSTQLEDSVDVSYTPKNTNVVVTVKNVPVGAKVRIRKDGTSVYSKTVRKSKEILNKGITLTGSHKLSVEVNDVIISDKTMSPPKPAKVATPKPAPVKAEPKVPVVKVTAPATIKVAAPKVVAPKVVKPKEPSYEKGLPGDGWKKYQQALRKHGYKGPVDGVPGKQTYEAMQISGKKFGYTGPIDGIPGENTYKAIQRRLAGSGFYEGRLDGIWGPVTLKALVFALDKNKY